MAVTNPAVNMLPAVTLAVAEINPLANTLTPVILPLTDTTAPSKLEPVTVPVALTKPPVVKLPPVILPDADIPPPPPLNVRALPYTLPVADINPAVNKLPPVTLPFAMTVPNTLTPVGENTATLPIVLTDIVTLAFAAAIFKLLPPFTTLDTLVIIPVNWLPLPKI